MAYVFLTRTHLKGFVFCIAVFRRVQSGGRDFIDYFRQVRPCPPIQVLHGKTSLQGSQNPQQNDGVRDADHWFIITWRDSRTASAIYYPAKHRSFQLILIARSRSSCIPDSSCYTTDALLLTPELV